MCLNGPVGARGQTKLLSCSLLLPCGNQGGQTQVFGPPVSNKCLYLLSQVHVLFVSREWTCLSRSHWPTLYRLGRHAGSRHSLFLLSRVGVSGRDRQGLDQELLFPLCFLVFIVLLFPVCSLRMDSEKVKHFVKMWHENMKKFPCKVLCFVLKSEFSSFQESHGGDSRKHINDSLSSCLLLFSP